MNIKKFRWSKALALLLALTMVMMYSFSFATAVYAKDNQKVEIHFDNFVLDESIDGVQVRIVAGGETYDSTSSKIDKNRKKAEAFYSKDSLPDTSTSVSSVIVTLMIDDDPQASFTNLKKDSNIGTGGGTYSTWIDAEKNPPTGSTLTIEKLIDSDLIDGDEVFNFNVTGPEGYDEDVSAGASDGVLTGLLLGDYIITEYYNDTNYLETDSQEMSITTLDWTDSVTFNNIPIESPPDYGSITINKTISGAAFGNNEEFEFTVVGEDFNEVVTAGSTDAYLGELELGEYTITETEASGYLPTTPQTITLTENNLNQTVNFINSPENGSTPDLGSITIHKTISGAAFGNSEEFEFTVVGEDFNEVVTAGSTDGYLGELELGEYTITETEASGYLPTTPQTITLAENNLNQTVNFINIPENGSTPDLGSITIHKTISGAAFGNNEEFEFTVVGEDFNEVVTAGSIDGYLGELELGEYTITETEASGYLPTTPQTITLAENNLNQTVNFNNESLINDLGVTKTANPSSMLLGASTYFVIIITNHGTMTAYNIDVKDTWPVGVSLSSVIADEGTTYEGATWSIGSLEPGDSKTLTLSAVTIATGTIENVVGIMGNGDDNPDNNTDSAIITVSTQTPTPGPTPTHHRTTPPTVIEEPVIPLAEEPVIPLAEEPVVTPIITEELTIPEEPVVTPIITEELTIPEEPTPLADVVPQTGDTNNILLLLGLLLASGTGIVALGRRKETAGK